MREMTLKDYAIKHKISLFNVMKLAKAGKIPSKTTIVDGKEEMRILTQEAPQPEPLKHESNIDYKKAYFELKKKYDLLLKKIGS